MEKTLPHKPKLRPYLHTVPRGDERLLFRGGGDTVVLKGASVRDLVPLLLPHLDGCATVPEIVAALPTVDGEVVAAALALLHEQRLLEDAAVAPPPEIALPERFREQGAFWLSLGGDRHAH